MANRLEGKLYASEIVNQVGMSARPEFYSGRGAIRTDLNSDKLEKIYSIINKEYGETSALEYAQMVADIPVLSATDFLLTLYRLEADDWKWNNRRLGNEKGIYIDGKTEVERFASAELTVSHVLSFGSCIRDETDSIRDEFLRIHEKKIKIKPKKKNISFYY